MTDPPVSAPDRPRAEPRTVAWPAPAMALLLVLAAVVVLVELLAGRSGVALWLVGHQTVLVVVWLIAYAVVAVAALVTTVRAVVRGRSTALARGAVLVKLCGIPFFVTNFVLIAAVLGVATLLGGGVAVLVAGPLVIIATYALMLPTTMFGLGCLAVLWRRRAVSTSFVVVHTILHLLFVTDIVSSLVVAHHARRA